jgi:hypothetical protein
MASTGWSFTGPVPTWVAPGTSACVSTARTPSNPPAAAVSMLRMRAAACGLRTVTPTSMFSARRSEA